jgi:hypothetical protein
MDLYNIPIFKIGDFKIDLPTQLSKNVIEINSPRGEPDINIEAKIWSDFLDSSSSHILIINSYVELDADFNKKISEVNQEIANIEFDCVFLGSTYLRALHNGRFFIDKQELINLYPYNLLLPDVMVDSNKHAYLINKDCAKKLLSEFGSLSDTDKTQKTILNFLIEKGRIKSYFCKYIIEKYYNSGIDSNRCGVFSTYKKIPQKGLILEAIDRNSRNWTEYECSAIVKHKACSFSDPTHFNPESKVPSNGIYCVDNGYLLSNGVALSENKKILEEVNLIPELNFRTERDKIRLAQILKHLKDKPIIKYSGTCLNLRSLQDYIYGHGLLGSLPKCKIAKDLLPNTDFDYVVLPQNFKHNHYILRYLNIPQDKVFEPSSENTHQFDKIICPTHRSPNRLYRHNNFDFIAEMFGLYSDHKPFRKIYIPRVGETRSPLNEDEVIDTFQKYGFEIIYPNKERRFLPQIFHESIIIAGPHGSNLSDACFCKPRTHILDILSPFHVYQYYSSLSFAIDGNYHSIIGDPVENFEKFQYAVNPDKVSRVLKSII